MDENAMVTLTAPVVIDGKEVAGITLRRPLTGELRGLKLVDVLQLDTDALLRLLPRITAPALSPAQVAALDPADLVALGSQALRFFLPREQLEMAGSPVSRSG